MSSPAYLGLDLSTQQLKVIAVTSDLEPQHEESVTFDTDLPHYGVKKGVHVNDAENEIYAPVVMWLEAVDLVLARMKSKGFDFSRVRGVSGAGQQHGSVYWSDRAQMILGNLDAGKNLAEQMKEAFSHPWSPNWQDHSTQAECDTFEDAVGGAEELARITGSKAHHRFTGPQILRFRRRNPDVYDRTARISLVSSFLCSVFLGRIAPFDISDVCGMNLWDLHKDDWDGKLLFTAAGGDDGVEELKRKLGDVERVHGKYLGKVSKYFVEKFGFSPDCTITPFTGDNPSTILALPLRPLDVIVSLGTSTTLLMSTPTYFPSPSYHLFNHPTTNGLYMFMLCYCNGALAREAIRDKVNEKIHTKSEADPWKPFSNVAVSTPPLGKISPKDTAKLGIYFPLPEIVPNVRAGTWRFEVSDSGLKETDGSGWSLMHDARLILESQALSMRMRSKNLLIPDPKVNGNKHQPRRVYVVGGASRNQAIAEVMGEVLGGVEGVYRLDVGGNACALGAAYYATWALERGEGEGFEEFVGGRWKEEGRVQKIAGGYKEGVWEKYGNILEAFKEAEERIIAGETRN